MDDKMKVRPIADHLAERTVRDAHRTARLDAMGKLGDTLDYNKIREQFKQMNRVSKPVVNTIGKKAIGAIPFAGAAYAALSGDPAMAAEELAGDIPVVGQAFEAIKPTPAGPAPGSMDSRIENGTLTDEDKNQMRLEALQKAGSGSW